MLLVTAIFNFILSKKTKTKSPTRPQESHSDQSLTTICVTERAGSQNTFPFLHMIVGRRGGVLGFTNERGEIVRAMLNREQTAAPKNTGRERRSWKERRLMCFRGKEEPVEREMEEIDGCCEPEPDTTSDTAPMITD
ncbi:hypothetical protein EXN66_Car001450 [Channa argus]|uniref:Uncharacterized protein n=2 Tax=Channa argus TaxID=215402 RepID=A0A6G1R1N0_CHAAH|nr:hypothetical protein EXN66_Car001450 [Channa argus]